MSFSTTSWSEIVPGECEVVPVHDAPHIQLGIVKAACTGLASGEPEALKCLVVKRLPTGRSGTSA
eukprot:13911763-Alexandrium_andersonii.AAC.1